MPRWATGSQGLLATLPARMSRPHFDAGGLGAATLSSSWKRLTRAFVELVPRFVFSFVCALALFRCPRQGRRAIEDGVFEPALPTALTAVISAPVALDDHTVELAGKNRRDMFRSYPHPSGTKHLLRQ